MRMNRRDFIKTTGVLGACACCGLPGFTQRSDFSTEPFTHKSQFPTTFQIDAGNICQLDCPECPAKILMRRHPGYGFLKFKNFKKFIDNNKNITDIELSKTGEIFLNPELLDIIKYAHKKNVSLTADNGVNGNYISDEVLEALPSIPQIAAPYNILDSHIFM